MATKNVKIIVFVFLTSIIIFGYWNFSSYEKRIERNLSISSGKVISYEYNYKSSKGYNYDYVVNGINYSGLYLCAKKEVILIDKLFPVIYNRLNPEESLLLIFPKDFKKHGLNFPDSLKWVLAYE
jgi:hypothetical protein